MSKRESIHRYGLIINYLRRGKASFEDILRYLERESEIQGYNFIVSKRTFQRDIQDIGSLYNIEIKCNKSTCLYFISEEDKANEQMPILEAFDLYNALNLTNNYAELIQFEQRKPKGTEHIYGLLHAIKNRFRIELIYQKNYEIQEEKRVVEPLLLKEFKGRFYLLAHDMDKNDIRTFGLDRIRNIEISKKHFAKGQNFDAKDYFKNAFGIIAPQDQKPVKVVFSLACEQGKYIKNYPLHTSQRIVKKTDGIIEFELFLLITYDFIMELLSYGPEIKILSPASLTAQLKTNYKKAMKIYS